MLDQNQIKAQISHAYLRSVAAHAGCVCEDINIDVTSVDATVQYKGIPEADAIFHYPKFDVQLKATSSWEWTPKGLPFDLSIKNYNDLRCNRQNPVFLVVLLMPRRFEEWLHHSEDNLITRHCAYWSNLSGYPSTPNGEYQRVFVPRVNVFSSDSIHRLMCKISRAENIGNGI